jgi:two-component system sensor histidine kinase BaeS
MRLSISKKISLSLILVLVLSIAAMAWLTGKSLQSGFNAYLKEKQLIDLHKVAVVLATYYREYGDFSGLRHNPRVVRPLIDRALERVPDSIETEADSDSEAPPVLRRDNLRTEQGMVPASEPPQTRRPPRRAFGGEPRPRPGLLDLGPRLSLIDEYAEPVFGPLRQNQITLQEAVILDGKTVGTVLAPVPEFAFERTTLDFIRKQMTHIIILALVLIMIAALVSVWLGKHLVSPIASLRKTTQQIANGHLHARAETVNQDEIGDLAQHINAMAKHLEQNELKRRKVMADLSHELRTPLTVIRAEVEAMIDGVRPLNVESVCSLEAEIRHLNKLVDDLHQLALVDAGDLRFHFENSNLSDLLQQLGQRFQARMLQAQLQLQMDIPERPVQLYADSSRLTQVLENLLENSLRYTDAGGKVVLRMNEELGMVRICIEDSAPGLAEGLHQKMFDRLYREDQARSRVKGGSGLGLSICRGLVHAHHGEIHASASALGGVKITILLPVNASVLRS